MVVVGCWLVWRALPRGQRRKSSFHHSLKTLSLLVDPLVVESAGVELAKLLDLWDAKLRDEGLEVGNDLGVLCGGGLEVNSLKGANSSSKRIESTGGLESLLKDSNVGTPIELKAVVEPALEVDLVLGSLEVLDPEVREGLVVVLGDGVDVHRC